jgi:glycosyltransferase involved in cell wall biosynthesis
LRRDYRPLEIIVSDDQSTDQSLSIVKSYKEITDIPILVFDNKKPGIGRNWNNCIRNANGAFIKFLFQDDLLHHECVSRMMDLALREERLGMVFCKREILLEEETDENKNWKKQYGDLQANWTALREVNNGKSLLGTPNLLLNPKK